MTVTFEHVTFLITVMMNIITVTSAISNDSKHLLYLMIQNFTINEILHIKGKHYIPS